MCGDWKGRAFWRTRSRWPLFAFKEGIALREEDFKQRNNERRHAWLSVLSIVPSYFLLCVVKMTTDIL